MLECVCISKTCLRDQSLHGTSLRRRKVFNLWLTVSRSADKKKPNQETWGGTWKTEVRIFSPFWAFIRLILKDYPWIRPTVDNRDLKILRKLRNCGEGKEDLKRLGYQISKYFSLESSVRHPYKGLYRGEQVFWKALRITFGNKAILWFVWQNCPVYNCR